MILNDTVQRQYYKVESDARASVREVSALVRAHVRQLNEELREQRIKLVAAVGCFAGALLSAPLALMFWTVAVIVRMTVATDVPGLAMHIMVAAGIWTVATIALAVVGIVLLKRMSLVPHNTIDSLEESIQCLLH